MSDPRFVPPSKRKNPLSPLMQAKVKASDGAVVNFCPFGCSDEELSRDDNNFCYHLVGFTKDAIRPLMEPRALVNGRIVVLGSKPEPMMKGDVLVKITDSFRVYRRAGNTKLKPPRIPGEEVPERLKEMERYSLRQEMSEGVWDPGAYA